MELLELEEKAKHHKKLFFMLFVVAVMATFFLFAENKYKENMKVEQDYADSMTAKLAELDLIAESVSVYDINTNKKIFSKDDDVPLPIASLAKILSVAVGLNNHKLDEVVYISPDAVKQAGDFGIFAYEKWKIADLAKFTLIVSANDGAYALTESQADAVEKINNKAVRLGLPHAFFMNATGLDIPSPQINCHADLCNVSPGAVATASEVNAMAVYAMQAYGEVFGATVLPSITLKSESGFDHTFKNTDVLVGKIPNLMFSKTGFTNLAGGNLCIIFKDKRGHAIAVTVLGSTFDGRFQDMEKIVNALIEA